MTTTYWYTFNQSIYFLMDLHLHSSKYLRQMGKSEKCPLRVEGFD